MRMLYRHPGRELLHGILCDYTLVPDTAQAIAEAQRDGWYRSPAEAFEAAQKPAEKAVSEPEVATDEPPVSERDFLELEASRLGIKIDGRWSIARLKSEIEKHAD